MLTMLFDYACSFAQTKLPALLIGTALFVLLRYTLCRAGVLARRSIPHEAGLALFALYLCAVLSLTFLSGWTPPPEAMPLTPPCWLSPGASMPPGAGSGP